MKASDWISVEDRLPDVDTMVLICTTNNKCGISSMYIPKDCHGKILGKKEWRGCGAMNKKKIGLSLIKLTYVNA